MIKLFITLTVAFAFPFLVLAQSLAPDQAEGYIIDKKGNRYEGIIELASLAKPWQNQEKVYFIEKSALDADGKISKKEKKKFDTKDLAEYQFGTRRFVLIKYTNIEGATKASGVNRFTAVTGALKNMTNNEFMAEVILDSGKVSLYRFYNAPPDVAVTSGQAQADELRRIEADCVNNYDILYLKKGDKEKAKAIARPGELSEGKQGFKKIIEDCKTVVKKYEDGGYTMQPFKKGLKGALKEAVSGKTLEEILLEIFKDYNKECA